ncbi:RNA-directed DNA polymerase (reversetranscriptase)-related family protein [Striga asiatica]|uniref:RNA-directed DNA polymerase (Reversetranscriptase)-related family protein n=1 Tax=Striga asiatica TaxID=4170 RepID=A0A5A7Q1S7_STRAF|nr:RNA-directed DNA polymerase (reversetranscriptase)-related family protein [Striga asiatica]
MEQDITEKLQKFTLSDREKSRVRLSDEDIEPGLQECNLSLIGKIVGDKKVNMGGLKTTMGVIWRTSRPFSVRILGHNHFQFLFHAEEDKAKVLRGKNWSFDNQYLLLKEWKKGETDFKDEELKVALWVQVHNLPLHWISEETGAKIGKVFDRIHDIAIPGAGSVNGKIVRILADINVLEPLPRGTFITLASEELWIDFRYENLLTFCFYCGRVGHNDRGCDLKKADIHNSSLSLGQYGEWLRGSYGGMFEPKEKRSSSPINPQQNSESSKAIKQGGGIESLSDSVRTNIPNHSIGERLETPDKTPIISTTLELAIATGSGSKTPENSKGKAIIIEPMEMDLSGIPNPNFSNLINVPISQAKSTDVPKQKTFHRITKNRGNVQISGTTKVQTPQSHHIAPQSPVLKRKSDTSDNTAQAQHLVETKKQKLTEVLVWNCRGLGGPSTIPQLKDNIRSYLPDFVFISEVKKKKAFVDTVCKNIPFVSSWEFVSPVVCFLWEGVGDRIWAIFVYASVEQEERKSQWQMLIRHHLRWGDLWFIGGDFNDILSNEEKNRGLVRSESSFHAFKNFTQILGVLECPFIGHPFTWSNGRQGSDFVEEKLDRFLLSPNWLLQYPKSFVTHVQMVSSDHHLLVLQTEVLEEKKRKIFCFDNRWVGQAGVEDCIREAWNSEKRCKGLYNFQKKLRNTKMGLLGWLVQNHTNSAKAIKSCNQKLEILGQQGGSRDWAEWENCKGLLHKAYKDEESYWKQKSRLKWLREGDSNTKFFQACVKQRRWGNSLENLVNSNGVKCRDRTEQLQMIMEYFQSIFQSANPDFIEEALSGIPNSITTEMNLELTRPVDEQEVKAALWDMEPSKSPGIDGFTPCFFQSYWEFIKKDLCSAIDNFLNTGCIPSYTNHTLITLIPKIKNPQKVSDFRPISLCTVSYRLFSKILASRLKHTLRSCISQSQAAFVPDRLILDNIVIANECLHFLNSKKKGKKCFMALKIDMAKAFDRIEWSFLIRICRKMGFGETFLSWIWACISTTSFSFNIGGQALGNIIPSRGLRQGDPLSPYLFIIVTEALSNLINKACVSSNYKGIQISKHSPSISHLFFADDALIFCHADHFHAQTLLNILNLYCFVSGQAVNLHKSNVFFSANTPDALKADICHILQGIVIAKSSKYLGLPLGIGRNKKDTFAFVKECVSSRIMSWRNKFLNEAGREILIKTVLSALPVYVMSIFRLPVGVCQDICRDLATFWWGKTDEGKSKIHWTLWSCLAKSKWEGGLGFRDLCDFNEALILKQLWRLLTKPNCLMSKVLRGRYFFRQNFMEVSKKSSDYWMWKGWLDARKSLELGMRFQVGSGKAINLWDSPWIPNSTKFKPVCQFADDKLHLKKVSDIMLECGKKWDYELIMQTFSPLDAANILKIHVSQTGSTDKLVWHSDKKGMFSVKEAYKTIQHNHKMKKGSEGSSRNTDKTISHIWNRIWKLPIKPKLRNFLWRCWHNWLGIRVKLHQRGMAVDTKCCWCGEEDEDIIHLFFKCHRAKRVWKIAGLDWVKLNQDHIDYREWWEDLCSMQNSVANGQRITLSTYLLWWMWRTRNHWIFNKVHTTELQLVKGAIGEWLEYDHIKRNSARSRSRNHCVLLRQGVGEHSQVPSASVQNIHKGHLLCKAVINGKEHVAVSVTGQKGNHQWESSLLQIREWLLMGERVGWQQVEIQVGCEILRQHLTKYLAFDCNIAVLASDIFALIPSFEAVIFSSFS